MVGDNYPKIDGQKPYKGVVIAALIAIAAVFFCLILLTACHAKQDYSDEDIAEAIYVAEGGTQTRYPYGIKSINTHGDREYARKICLTTIRNNRKRFAKQSKCNDFIVFLGSRYCPPGAHRLNKYWVTNVKRILAKGER